MTAIPPTGSLFSARVRVDGCTEFVVVYETGLTIGTRPGRGRLMTWSEISRLADGPPADRFGLVVNGRLFMVYEEETDAQNQAADQRALGNVADVIRVPINVNT
jgi:hypothetical protein